jgi:hypothetical protein
VARTRVRSITDMEAKARALFVRFEGVATALALGGRAHGALRGSVLEQSDRTYLYSPYLEDHHAAADAIGAWLMQPAASARIEAAFFAAGDARLQKLLSDALAGGAT